MGAATALPVRDVRVDPGATETVTMLVRNTGQVVDQFTVEILGDCGVWTQISPAVVNLLPGADVEVTVSFAPPRDPHVRAGLVPFGIRVGSREDPSGSTVAEGSVEVGAFDDVQVDLVPRQSKGRRRARHQVAIDNNGNQPTSVEVTAHDEEEALDFAFDHRVATIEPGSAAFIRLYAKPEKRFFKGADRQHPFVVTVAPSNSTPVATRGTMTQRQLLPSWLLPLLAILLVLAILAFVLYQTLLKPAIESTAKDAAEKAAKSAASSAASSVAGDAKKAAADAAGAKKDAAAAKKGASKANAGVASVAKSGAGGGGGTTQVTGSGGVQLDKGTATAFSIQAAAPVTKGNLTAFRKFTAPVLAANKAYVVTYVIMQNPNGDVGTLQMLQGNDVLLTEGLQNFRDLDHPFQVEPLVFTKARPLSIAVNCQKTTTTTCQPSVLFTGRIVNKKTGT